MRLNTCAILAIVCAIALRSGGATDVNVWVEGEQPARQQVVDNEGLNKINPAELSAGGWLSSFTHDNAPAGTAEYSVEIAQAGAYHLWVRAAMGTGLSYRCDSGEWQPIDGKKAVDTQYIASDGNWFWPPPVAWHDAGTVDLSGGNHTIAFLLGGTTAKDRYAGIDCFLLTTGAFTPHGKFKPDEQPPPPITFHPGNTWDLNSDSDALDPTALLDLRYLNEKSAGEHGFVRLSADGNGFVRGDGTPLRFWCMAGAAKSEQPLAALQRGAQFLAKRGVNFMRIGVTIKPGKGEKITDVNEKGLDYAFRAVAALKSAGIYSMLIFYWGCHADIQPEWKVNPNGNQNGDGLLFIEIQRCKPDSRRG